MELTVLGSGGNSPTPMPTCGCRVCTEAREKGAPYARRGNSLFVHILLTHFHADHTMGLGVLQALGIEFAYDGMEISV